MALKLYGSSRSPYTRSVAIVLHEKQVPFELVKVSLLNDENKCTAYLAKQPFGQVPCIDDDGLILYESRAICRYLATKYHDQGTPLVPLDSRAYVLFEQAASVEQNNFHPYAYSAAREMVFKPIFGLTPDRAVFEDMIDKLSAKLDVYDVILGKQRYIAGDELTLADLFHLPLGAALLAAGCNVMTQKPNVARWFNELVNRPSWQAVKDGNFGNTMNISDYVVIDM